MPSNAKRMNSGIRRSRVALFSILLPLLAFSLPSFADATQSTLRLVYIVLGFSLIIFLHELGHFVVARLSSVKCLAFSIGIGPRLCGWRKGGKFTFGNDPYDLESGSGKPTSTNQKTPGEKEDEKYALKSLDADKPIVHTEKGPVQIQPDTANLTADILGKPQAPQEHHVNPNESDLQTTAREPHHPASVGNCDYRVSWLPLGGYVRMLGQDDMDPTKISTDPHAFNQRPIWQRMCIVSAGVIMNIIFAAVAFSIIFSPGIGVEFPAAVVGAVYQDMPAAAANLHMGDQVLAINGVKPLGQMEFVDLQMAAALSDGVSPITLLVRPYGTHGEADHDVSITPKANDSNKLLAVGVESLPGLKIAGSGKDYIDPDAAAHPSPDGIYEKNLPELEKIRAGDKIAAINGTTLTGEHPYMALYQLVQDQQGKAVTLTLDNVKTPGTPAQTITILPHLEPTWGLQEYPTVLGIAPRAIIDEPMEKSPAAGKLKEGDTIVRVGAQMYPTPKDVQRIVGASMGEPLEIAVERGTASTATAPAGAETTTYTLSAKNNSGKWIIGVPLRQDVKDTSFIPPADPNSPLAALPHDARITAIDGTPVATWLDIYSALRSKPAGAAVPVTFAIGSSSQTIPLTLSADDHNKLANDLHYQLGLHLEFEMINQHGKNPAEAVMLGLDHTKKFILQVYMTLYGLFRGTVSPSNLHGIVGITKVGYDVQERGPVWLWYVLAMVSVNLAVANFLPLPIVDGGLFLLLILEKIRGKPLSLKVQSAIQVVGVVLLIGLFLFVTYNDLSLFHK